VKGVFKDRNLLKVARPTKGIDIIWSRRMTHDGFVRNLECISVFRLEVAVPAGEGMLRIHLLYALVTFQTETVVKGARTGNTWA
jgi:hypothetical protein